MRAEGRNNARFIPFLWITIIADRWLSFRISCSQILVEDIAERSKLAMVVTNKFGDVDTITADLSPDVSGLRVCVELTGLKVGIIEALDIQYTAFTPELSREIDTTCHRLRGLHSFDNLRQWESVHALREIFRKWGVDPSKYRPSPEALLGRVIRGEALPRISTIVDIGNLGAIEMGWSYGCYNRERLSDFIEIRLGKAGEQYEGIGRQTMRLEGRPVFADAYGPFGSPIRDSTRTMVTESTHDLLAIVCAPENSCDSILEEAISRLAERLVRWCGAREVKKKIVKGTLDD